MPLQITTHAVGEEGTTYPSGEEEVGPITRPGEEEEHQTAGDDHSGSLPATTLATGEEAGQGPSTLLVGEETSSHDASFATANPFGAF